LPATEPLAEKTAPAPAGPGGVLRRVLGFRTIVSTSAGLAFAAVNFLAVMEIRGKAAGILGPLAIVIAGCVCLLAAAVFSELNGTIPSAAGIRVWTLRGLGDPFSLTFTLLYLFTVLAVIAADGFVLASALHAVLPAIPGAAWIVLFLSAALVANLRGVQSAGLVQDLTTYGLLAALIVICVAALGHPGHLPPTPATWPVGLFSGIALGVFVFMGFEWVTPLAEELRQPTRMPQGLGLSLLALALAFGLFALVAARLPGVTAGGLVPQLAVGRSALGAAGFWIMLAVTVVTAGTTFNGSFVSASRLLYALGRSGHLPASLGRLNARFAPARALWMLYGVSVAMTLLVFTTRRYLILINAGATLESAMYVVAALALLGLRRRAPEIPRTWRAPWGRVLPIAAVVVFGVLGIGAATTADGLPLPGVPWTVVLLGLMALGAWWYARAAIRRRALRTPAARRAAERP
jgi:amino acid transporter